MVDRSLLLSLVKKQNPDDPVKYVHNIVRDYAREKLDQHILNCQDCPCSKNNVKSITKGRTDAPVIVISEHVITNQGSPVYPLEGTKGYEVLLDALSQAKISEDDIFYINTVNCYPTKQIGGKKIPRIPTKSEVDQCRVYLDYAIEIVKPEIIITLGAIALNSYKKCSIYASRGVWTDIKGIPTMPTYHPEMFFIPERDALISGELKQTFFEDIKKIGEIL